MCLALPTQIIELRNHQEALIDLNGVQTTISIALTPHVCVGDYVIVHVGYAIGVVDAIEAQKTLAIFQENLQ